MDGRQAEQAVIDPKTLARQIKWVRAELVGIFVERHLSFVLAPECLRPIELNLPTAVGALTQEEAYRAFRLLAVLRKLTYAVDQGADTLPAKSADAKRLKALQNKDNGLRVKGVHAKKMRLYTREQVRTFIEWVKRRYDTRRPVE